MIKISDHHYLLQNRIPNFKLIDISVSLNPNRPFDLNFIWDQSLKDVEYIICLKDKNKKQECNSLGSVKNKNNVSIYVPYILNLYDKEFFIQAKYQNKIRGSNSVKLSGCDISKLIQHLKVNTQNGAGKYGCSVSISKDNRTVAIGTMGDKFGYKNNNHPALPLVTGGVSVYEFDGKHWILKSHIKPSLTYQADDRFGHSLALNEDGSKLLIGAPFSDLNSKMEFDSNLTNSGAVYLYERKNGDWFFSAYLTAETQQADSLFGYSSDMSNNGKEL